MINVIFFILTLAMPVVSIAQNSDFNKGMECDSKNQGEQEDCWAKAVFQKEYTTEYYKRYEGKVQPVYDNKYRYGNKFIEISNPTNGSFRLMVLLEKIWNRQLQPSIVFSIHIKQIIIQI